MGNAISDVEIENGSKVAGGGLGGSDSPGTCGPGHFLASECSINPTHQTNKN